MSALRRTRRIVAMLGVSLIGVLSLGGSAQGEDVRYVYDSSLNGAGNPTGAFVGPASIPINLATGHMIVYNQFKYGPGSGASFGAIEQVDLDGNAVPFTAPYLSGSTVIGVGPNGGAGGEWKVNVDNSGGPTQGRIYAAGWDGPMRAFDPTGEPLGGHWPLPLTLGTGFEHCGVGVDSKGYVWTANYGLIVEHTPDGVPTGRVVGGGRFCEVAFDSEDNLYAATLSGFVSKFKESENYANGVLIDNGPATGIAIDPATDFLYVVISSMGLGGLGGGLGFTGEHVNVYRPSGEGYGSFGRADFLNSYDGLDDAKAIAVDTEGLVYVSDAKPGEDGRVNVFKPVTAPSPTVSGGKALDVLSDGARLQASIGPNSEDTAGVRYHFEYGLTDSYGNETPERNTFAGTEVSQKITGLQPNTLYHYRVIAENDSGADVGEDRIFSTFPQTPGGPDPCPNALARKQTTSRALMDCRAYELVSAADTSGYDVTSDVVPGLTPFGSYPNATNPPRVLYSVVDGAISGTGQPTNFGPDPYVATRDENGRWSTKYVGIPANGTPSTAPFTSEMSGAADGLGTLAFSGPGLCSPCFGDGKTGIPVHRPDGSLVQGMAGSFDPGPSAEPDVLVRKRLSADGDHLLFGSTSEFEEDADDGEPTIYHRDLSSSTTTVVSKLPNGDNIPCLTACASKGVAGLDISSDGSRIVVGQLISTDVEGNDYFHLYMNVGDSDQTIDLTPGTTSGALYAGMSSDGSSVYFTTLDPLATSSDQDTDDSADLFRADVDGASATLTRVSTGSGAGDTDDCDPPGTSAGPRWNKVGTEADCSVLAIGGGGGVASDSGDVYFLSPEKLDGNGEQDSPNLFLARKGAAPQFIATLESSLTGPTPALTHHPLVKTFGKLKTPTFVAIDNSGGPSDGDVYVADTTKNKVYKFDADGNAITSWGNGGEVSTPVQPSELVTQIAGIAVDTAGVLYVVRTGNLNTKPLDSDQAPKILYKFEEDGSFLEQFQLWPSGPFANDLGVSPYGLAVDSAGNIFTVNGTAPTFKNRTVSRFNSSGEWTGYITSVSGIDNFPNVAGIAVDQATDDLYVAGTGILARFDFTPTGEVIQTGTTPCDVKGGFGGCPPTHILDLGFPDGAGVSADPAAHHVYAHDGHRILEFDSEGTQIGAPNGVGVLSGPTGVAANDDGEIYAANAGALGGNVALFGPSELAPDPRTDNPMVLNGLRASEERRTADFQTTPSGDHAVFPSTVSLTDFPNAEHSEVFRYDAQGDKVDCASCSFANPVVTGDSYLARNGSSITDNGSVFFTSTERLVLADSNKRTDAYQWQGGEPQLISTGTSPYDAGLLGVSADGTDVYFFTRDTLVAEDKNGVAMKIYDARSEGGFFVIPPPPPCAASDECHGPSSPTAAPPAIRTIAGKPANAKGAGARCKKGKVKRRGKCVPKKRSKKQTRSQGARR